MGEEYRGYRWEAMSEPTGTLRLTEDLEGNRLPENALNLLVRRGGARKEEIRWTASSMASKERLLAGASWDVDYISVCGRVADLFSDAAVLAIIADMAGQLFRRCSLKVARSGEFKHILMVGKVGSYLLGEPLRREESNENDSDEEEEGQPEEVVVYSRKQVCAC